MNQALDQFNALVTSLKMVENENTKLKAKLDALEAEDNLIKEDLQRAEEELAKGEQNIKTLNEEHTKTMLGLDEQISKCKEETNQRQEEKDLYFEIKQIEKEIAGLKESNEFLVHEIEDVREGKLTPNFSKYLQSKVGKEDKEKLLDYFIKTIKIDKTSGVLSMVTIAKIFEATILYYSRTYISKTYEERIERRKYLNDVEKYLEIAIKQQNEFDNAVDAAQLELLQKLGISLPDFSASVELYFTQGNQDVYYLTSTLPQRLKMFLPSRKNLHNQILKDMLKYQNEILPSEFKMLDLLKKFKDDLTPDRVTIILNNRLFDKTYDKYNAEEEDFLAAMQTSECKSDYEIRDLLMSLRNSIVQNTPATITNTFGYDISAEQPK